MTGLASLRPADIGPVHLAERLQQHKLASGEIVDGYGKTEEKKRKISKLLCRISLNLPLPS